MRVLSVVHGDEVRGEVFDDVVRGDGHELDEWWIVERADPPRPLDDYDAVLVFGGAMNVDQEDEHPWLRREDEFVRGLWWHYPLAICSGALREEIEAMLEGVALRECFKVIVAAEDVTVGKPDPQGYMLCMAQLGQKIKKTLRPEQCLVVEDAPTVIRSVASWPTRHITALRSPRMAEHSAWQVARPTTPLSFARRSSR